MAAALAGGAGIEHAPGKGFSITSDDGRFGLRIRSRIQLLETVAAVDDGPIAQGFSLRRARLDVSGHGFGQAHRWRMQLGFSDRDLGNGPDGPAGSPLLDAYWEYRPDGPVLVRIGQYKVPLTRARIGSTSVLEFVDRSELDGELGLDRDRGAVVEVAGLAPEGEEPRVRGRFGVMGGDGRTSAALQDLGVLVLARAEVMPTGAFAYYTDGDPDRSESPQVGFGGGVARLWGASTVQGITGWAPTDGGTTDMSLWTVDAGFRWHGFSIDGAASGRTGVRRAPGVDPTLVEAPRNAFGATGQVGFVFPVVPVSVAGRYTAIDPVGTSSMPRVREAVGAVGWFIAGHPYDLTLDVSRLTEDAEQTWRARLQLELAL